MTSADFPAPETVPIEWFYNLLKDCPSGFRDAVIAMLKKIIAPESIDNNKPLGLLLTLEKMIARPISRRIWTSVDDCYFGDPEFTEITHLFGLFSQIACQRDVDKSLASLITTIETLWARNGTTLRYTVLAYECDTPHVSIEISSAAHVIIEDSRLIACASPMDQLSNLVAQLSRQRQIITEPVRKWFELIRDLPTAIQNDATCRLCTLLAKALTPPSYQ
jgi:hypothetical protein